MTTYTSNEACLLGLIGRGISKSLSPALHQAAGDALGIRTLYRLIDLQALELGEDDLGNILSYGKRLGFSGFNVTYPYKQAIIPLLDTLSEEAAAIGAVNTVLFVNGKSVGHNTDVSGFIAAFQEGLPGVRLDRVIQLGAGGAGMAVAHAAMALNVGELVLVDTMLERAERLAATLCERHGAGRAVARPATDEVLAEANGLIHCTPTGMNGLGGLPLPGDQLHADLWVADIVYFPLETDLLRAAWAIGCRTLDGGAMVTFQAAHAFALFSGRTPDALRMRQRFLDINTQ